jgi:hypothetical protein
MIPNAHSTAASKRPEPAHHILSRFLIAGQPSHWTPAFRVREDVRVAVERVCLSADANSGRNIGIAIQGDVSAACAGLGSRDGGVSPKRLENYGIEDRKRVKSARRRKIGICTRSLAGKRRFGVHHRGGKREEFGA